MGARVKEYFAEDRNTFFSGRWRGQEKANFFTKYSFFRGRGGGGRVIFFFFYKFFLE